MRCSRRFRGRQEWKWLGVLKQLRLNCTAALYALSCAGRLHCREVAALGPMPHLKVMLEPPLGRTPQDDQMQLFAALLVVNIVHAKGVVVPKESRPELQQALQRAHDDAQEKQARVIIALGIKHISKMSTAGGKGTMSKMKSSAKGMVKSGKGLVSGSSSGESGGLTQADGASFGGEEGGDGGGGGKSKSKRSLFSRK